MVFILIRRQSNAWNVWRTVLIVLIGAHVWNVQMKWTSLLQGESVFHNVRSIATARQPAIPPAPNVMALLQHNVLPALTQLNYYKIPLVLLPAPQATSYSIQKHALNACIHVYHAQVTNHAHHVNSDISYLNKHVFDNVQFVTMQTLLKFVSHVRTIAKFVTTRHLAWHVRIVTLCLREVVSRRLHAHRK